MNTELKFKIYEYYPAISKMIKDNYSQQDYLCIGVELSFLNQAEKRQKNANVFLHFLIDYYEKNFTLSYDIPSPNSVTDDFYVSNMENIKIPKTKGKEIYFDTDKFITKLTHEENILNTNYENLETTLSYYLQEKSLPLFRGLKDFLVKNSIEVDLKQYDKTIKKATYELKKFFSSEHLNTYFPQEVDEVKKFLSNRYLEKLLDSNKSSRNKAKL